MNQPTLSRLGAACGAVLAIVLVVANGDGSQPFSGPRALAGIAAVTLVVPVFAYLCGSCATPVLPAPARPARYLTGWAPISSPSFPPPPEPFRLSLSRTGCKGAVGG
jgi:hypothetical protein